MSYIVFFLVVLAFFPEMHDFGRDQIAGLDKVKK